MSLLPEPVPLGPPPGSPAAVADGVGGSRRSDPADARRTPGRHHTAGETGASAAGREEGISGVRWRPGMRSRPSPPRSLSSARGSARRPDEPLSRAVAEALLGDVLGGEIARRLGARAPLDAVAGELVDFGTQELADAAG